jgi:TatD DNase family protein
MLIDSHCHLQNIQHIEISKILENCEANKIERLLSVCIGPNDISVLRKIALEHENIDISTGIHPCSTTNEFNSFGEIEKEASYEKVVAIGETGLDYFKADNKKEQISSFVKHINLSNSLNKSLIIHTRSAAKDTIDIMKSEAAKRAVVHCFTESIEVAKSFLDLGYFISIAGIVTFKNALDLKKVAKYVPLDRLMVETDSPYLAPAPFRGKPCEPSYVIHTAKEIANIKNISLTKLALETTKNYYKFSKF